MRPPFKTVLWILIPFLVQLQGCTYSYRLLRYNAPNISDHRIFPYRTIANAEPVYPLREAFSPLPPVGDWALGRWYHENDTKASFFKRTGTLALLVLRNDTLVHEWYAPGFDKETEFTSFSLAKIYISSMVGIALEEGYIDSLDQPVTDFLPELAADSSMYKVTLRHLLQMTSGLKVNESYFNPFSRSARMYYGQDLDRSTSNLKTERTPGTGWRYLNTNTQVLGMALEKAIGRNISSYLEEKIWKPLGMESPATWSLDHESGTEKAFCCLQARARDFARFGLLILHEGYWRGQQLIPKDWIYQSTHFDTVQGALAKYQNQWYLTAAEEDFYGQGLLGQFTYVHPESKTVIVRLGKGLKYKVPWYDMFRIITGITKKPRPVPVSKERLARLEGTYIFGPNNFGDTNLVGKTASIKPRPNGLRVTTSFGNNFILEPESDTSFFHLMEGRWLRFHLNGQESPDSIAWSRRGYHWTLIPEGKYTPPQSEPFQPAPPQQDTILKGTGAKPQKGKTRTTVDKANPPKESPKPEQQ